MGTRYSSTTVSSYNSAPPSDDASTASTNQVKWSTIKGKLSDPLNTFAAAINSALVTAFDYSARLVTSADSTVAGDHMRTLEAPSSVTTTFTISLADAATMTNGYIVRVRNSSQVGITIGRATVGDTLDGAAANKLLPPGATGIYAVNASANGYITQAYAGPVQDTDAIVAGGTDGTKKVRLEVDGLTTATTRVLTVPDYDATLATQAGTETLTNKTLTSPTLNTAAAGGVWTAASTWTLPAFTLGGAVTGNGQNISGLGTLGAGATTVTTLTASAKISGTNTAAEQGLFYGYSVLDAVADATKGSILLGSNASFQGIVDFTSDGDTALTIANSFNNAAATVLVKVKNGAGAYVNPGKFTSAAFAPGTDNTFNLGSALLGWKELFCDNGTINTSDATRKTAVTPLTTPEINAAKALLREIGTFQFLDALAAKGDEARHHVGMTVQRAIEVMQSHGLDPFRYGFICFDEWAEETDAEGNVTKAAGSKYGFRADQLALFLARGLDARLTAAGL